MGAIRLFLALSVVVWHLPGRSLTLLDAGVAVLFFFMISGFYMALVINERYAATQLPGWRTDFYLSRLFRLFPAYLIMLVIMVAWFKWTDTPSVFLNHPNMPLGAHVALVSMNLFIVGQDFFQLVVNSISMGHFNPFVTAAVARAPKGFFDNEWMLIGQAWSLASELLFYAVAPFVVRSPRRIVLCLAASLLVRWSLIFGLGLPSEVWGYNFFPATLCLFLLGSLAYHLYDRVRFFEFTPKIGTAVTIAYSIFVAISLWRSAGVLLINRETGYDTLALWSAYLAFAASLPFLFSRWKSSIADRLVGELSYPLYIVHGLIIGIIFDRIKDTQIGHEFKAVAYSLVAAVAIFILVDRPIDAWRHRKFGKPQQPRRSWIFIPVAAFIGLIAYTSALDALARPEAGPPILVGTAGRYNIVHYDDRYFGVLQGQPITWGAPGYQSLPGLIIEPTYAAVLRAVPR